MQVDAFMPGSEEDDLREPFRDFNAEEPVYKGTGIT